MSSIQRRLALLIGAALCIAAFSVGTASADVPVEVLDSSTSERCSDLYVDGPTVELGCEINEVEGRLFIYSGSTLALDCHTYLDLRAGGDGSLYGINQEVKCGGYEREACTMTHNGKKVRVPWDGAIRGLGGNEFAVDMDICLQVGGYQGGQTQPVTFAVDLTGNSGLEKLTQTSGYPPFWGGGLLNSFLNVYDGDAVVVAEAQEEEEG